MSNLTWYEAFGPVMAQGREIRKSQETLGQAIIDVIDEGGSLLAEASTGTGKSLAVAVPMIKAIHASKSGKGKKFRGAISTETITLQNQICNKDLPELQKIYGGFTFKKLMGRSNYLCMNVAKQASIGNMGVNSVYSKLEKRLSSLTTGERSDVEKVVGRTITNDVWERITSVSEFCPDNMCSTEECFSTKARAEALKADIVVCNHALLATDIELKIGAVSSSDDGVLGELNALAVDEGHQLEPVLVSQWTTELTERELVQYGSSIHAAIDAARNVISNESIGDTTEKGIEQFLSVLKNIKDFYHELAIESNEEWKNSSTALSLKYINGSATNKVNKLMNEFEIDNPKRLESIEAIMETVGKYLQRAVSIVLDEKIKGVRELRKGLRASLELRKVCQIISKAIETKDGIISQFGSYGVLVDGWEHRDGTTGMTIRMVPLDISVRAAEIWKRVKSNILLSATLTDLTDGTFRYARACVAFPDGKELKVGTPFNLQEQQLVYITKGEGSVVEGARYNFNELISLIHASQGRALILFTSRAELDWAAEQIKGLKLSGHFPYPLLVQDADSDKEKLAKSFISDINSVLLATKSFFTGFDASGETLSLVALVKFPLARFSAECRQQIAHWRKRGFPDWYSRESLTTFQQAAGRLIRSSSCIGVVGLLDYRLTDSSSNVYKTALLGVQALGSPVTRDIALVQKHLS